MISFIIGFPIGVALVLSYYYITEWRPRKKNKYKPQITYVSSKLNSPGLRIPVKNVKDTIVWVDEEEK